MNRPPPRFTKTHAAELTADDWPGNIWELQDVVERSVILAQGSPLRFELAAAAPAEFVATKPVPTEPLLWPIPNREPLLLHVATLSVLRSSERPVLLQADSKVIFHGRSVRPLRKASC